MSRIIRNKINFYIYKITNLVDGKFYIGRRSTSKEINKDTYFGSGGIHFKRAIKKYGKENFKKEILQICGDFDTLCKCEEFWIKESDAINLGYNILITSDGYKPMELHPYYKKDKTLQPFYGKKHSEESKKKIGEKSKLKVYTEEIRQKHSLSSRGENNPMYGKRGSLSPGWKRKQSEEEKLKRSLKIKGRTISEKTRSKLKDVWRRKDEIIICPHCGKKSRNKGIMIYWHFDNCKFNPLNDITLIKIKRRESNPMLNKKVSEETKSKISAKTKGRISWNKGLHV